MLLKDHILSGQHNHRYSIQFAKTDEEMDLALQLRYDIFNLELKRGFAFASNKDIDKYDEQFHHLLVKEKTTGNIIGTYRMQTYEQANKGEGFYSQKRFYLEDLPADILKNGVEVGRACIQEDHRSGRVLYLLWKGIAAYLEHFNKRYLFGSSALTSTEHQAGWLALQHFKKKGYVDSQHSVRVKSPYQCDKAEIRENTYRSEEVEVPNLLQNYFDVGSRVCGGPALDEKASSIYFFTLLDIHNLSDRTRRMFFG